ncbi:MAG: V-type ATPase subunit [Rhodobacteraceae bacterium]|nr:V-type ATPase subunit [Paracoccaceae bacterium]
MATLPWLLSGAQAEPPPQMMDAGPLTPLMTITLGADPSPPQALSGQGPQASSLPARGGIWVSPLGTPAGRDGVGLLPPATTGLPPTLWQFSATDDLLALIEQQDITDLPALQGLIYALLLAEAHPPLDSHQDRLLLARIDKLIDLGALEQAYALIERAGAATRGLYDRWLDVALLMGQETRPCEALAVQPALSANYSARIFCAAHTGDWEGAVWMLGVARTLGFVNAQQEALLLRYLDYDLFDSSPARLAGAEVTALSFRLHEAAGTPLATALLPLPFAHTDLRRTVGWKMQLEAAEKLARTGALSGNRLLGVYTARRPAASGMVWERVAAIQALDEALDAQGSTQVPTGGTTGGNAGGNAAVARALPAAWRAMQQARLEVPFADIYGPRLMAMDLPIPARDVARKLALLSNAYEQAARQGPPDFLAMLALGTPPPHPPDRTARAIADAFHGAGVPQFISMHLARGQLGEAILRTLLLLREGIEGNLPALTDSLAALKAMGLEQTARRLSLQILIIGRHV